MSRLFRLPVGLLLLILLALPLGACGKKGQPSPPAGDTKPYPQRYPSPTSE